MSSLDGSEARAPVRLAGADFAHRRAESRSTSLEPASVTELRGALVEESSGWPPSASSRGGPPAVGAGLGALPRAGAKLLTAHRDLGDRSLQIEARLARVRIGGRFAPPGSGSPIRRAISSATVVRAALAVRPVLAAGRNDAIARLQLPQRFEQRPPVTVSRRLVALQDFVRRIQRRAPRALRCAREPDLQSFDRRTQKLAGARRARLPGRSATDPKSRASRVR